MMFCKITNIILCLLLFNFQVEVQMLQVYLDNVDDLLVERKKKGKPKVPTNDEKLKIVLAEHSSTGMVQVEGAEMKSATTAF